MQLSPLVPGLFRRVNGKELAGTMGFWLGFGCWAAPVEPPGLPHLRGVGMEWPHIARRIYHIVAVKFPVEFYRNQCVYC